MDALRVAWEDGAGLLCVLAALIGAAFVLPRAWITGSALNPAALTNFCLILFSGVQFIALGIIGEYLGRVHRNGLKRPLYLLDRQRGWQDTRMQSRPGWLQVDAVRAAGQRSLSLRQPAA